MLRSNHIALFLLSAVLLVLPHITFHHEAIAQEPTPFSPIVPQGNPNTGQVQPFALTDIAIRTGITPWLEAGWTGAGVRVGVLDRGFGGLLTFEQTFGTDVTVATGGTDATYDASDIIHGTQVLEVLHRISPGAELFACEYDSLDTFNLCIDFMISAGVRVINHSAGVPALPLDGTNPWALQVDRAAAADILWAQSAGNFAQGYYRDFLTYSDPMNAVHEFRGRTGIETALAVNAVSDTATGVVMLSWEDHNGLSANSYDLDLYIFDPDTGDPIGDSARTQAGMPGDEALEYDRIPMKRPFAIQIRDNTGQAFGIPFALYVEFAQIPSGVADRSIIAPGDSRNALTVGALQGFRIAPYSSRGPIGEGVIKPDITAPGEILLANGTNFIGTSAAAPLVAGSAALILEAEPGLSQIGLRGRLLEAVQDDDQFPGIDTNYGRGRVFLPNISLTAPTTSTEIPMAPTEVASFTFPGLSLTLPINSNQEWIPFTQDFNDVEMMLVPAGCFEMGSNDGETNARPPHQQCINKPFWIDRMEVSNADYGGFGFWSLPRQPREIVNWFEAQEFCTSRGGRLPTEVEWEYAARGPDNLLYPWGNTFTPANSTYGFNSDRQTGFVDEREDGASWVGVLNLSGNVWEWTSSASVPYPYNDSNAEINDLSANRVLRGGSWINAEPIVSGTYRLSVSPDERQNTTGFRCARDFDVAELDTAAFNNRERPETASNNAQSPLVEITGGVNLRSGPGTEFEVVGSARQGQTLTVIGRASSNGSTWYQVIDLDSQVKWVASSFAILRNAEEADLPVSSP